MGWIVPTTRLEHPCIKPGPAETESHRRYEMWRCELCGSLFEYNRDGDRKDEWRWVTSWITRWRYRNQGWTTTEVDALQADEGGR